MRKTSILHVGVHKTGTTSIQSFLGAQRERFKALDIDVYEGHHDLNNHVELHTSTMREDRLSPFKLDHGLQVDPAYQAAVSARVGDYVARSTASRVLFSAEGLSYLRYADEMDRLRSLLPDCDIQIVFYVRDREGFLTSYRRELHRHRLPDVIDRDSFAYVADDTWLVDFERRIAAFQAAFGPSNVIVLDYDSEMRACGNIIPSFLRTLRVETAFGRETWDDIFMNRHELAG